MHRSLSSAARSLRSCTTQALCVNWFVVALLLIILLGMWLRLFDYFTPPSMWVDEVAQVLRIGEIGPPAGNVHYPVQIRPYGYLLINKILYSISNTEVVLRLSSLVPSLLTVLIFPSIFRRLFAERLVVLAGTFLIAVNPSLILYSTEFKPYALEAFWVALLVLVLLLRRDNPRHDIGLIIVGLFGTAVTFAALFVLPPAMLSLLPFRRRSSHSADWRVIAVIGAGYFASYGLQYALNISHVHIEQEFPVEFAPSVSTSGLIGSIHWYARASIDLVSNLLCPVNFILARPLARAIGLAAFGALLLSGLVWCLTRVRFDLILLSICPVLLTLALGLANKWPYGGQRNNIFLIPLLAIMTAAGLQYFFDRLSRGAALIVLLALAVIYFPYHPAWYAKRDGYGLAAEEIRQPLARLYQSGHPYIESANTSKVPLYLNAACEIAFTYYVKIHDVLSSRYGPFFKQHFDVRVYADRSEDYIRTRTAEVLLKMREDGNDHAIFLSCHQPYGGGEFELIEHEICRAGEIIDRKVYPGTVLLVFKSR
jgi:hypothetical protein